MIKIKCKQCGRIFETYPSNIKWGKGKYHNRNCFNKALMGDKNPFFGKTHSKETRERLSQRMKGMTGRKNPNYRGGKTKHAKGYIHILSHGHPNVDRYSYIFEHRLVAEKKLNRYLTKEERVHHINGVKDDNRPENLYLFSTMESHVIFHNRKIKPTLISNI